MRSLDYDDVIMVECGIVLDGFVTLCVTLLVLVVDTGKELGTVLVVNTGKEHCTVLVVNLVLS